MFVLSLWICWILVLRFRSNKCSFKHFFPAIVGILLLLCLLLVIDASCTLFSVLLYILSPIYSELVHCKLNELNTLREKNEKSEEKMCKFRWKLSLLVFLLISFLSKLTAKCTFNGISQCSITQFCFLCHFFYFRFHPSSHSFVRKRME